MTFVVLQYCETIEQAILSAYDTPSNCTVGNVQAGSVVVPTTVAFSAANADAATAAQTSFASDLRRGSGIDIFAPEFGSVTVAASSVTTGTTANPGKSSQSM